MLYTSPILQECDIELIKETFQLALSSQQLTTTAENDQLAFTYEVYLVACNEAFLASERIRNFLILCLTGNLIITFIVLASIPVTPLSISLVCFTSLILFSINLFTLYQQMHGIDQKNARNSLLKCNENFKKILISKNLDSNATINKEKIQTPTTNLCLFPATKTSPNEELKQPTDDDSINASDNSLPPKLNAF